MSAWWSGLRRRQWVIIVMIALAVALVALLWIDVGGAGDPRLCGQCLASDCFPGLAAGD
jgi:hypothetical protein